jgi:hypothetical protein
VSQVLVGLHRVGIVGLNQACEKVVSTGLSQRSEIVDFLRTDLAADNYLPKEQEEAYSIALWREYLRFVGEDFREFFSEIEVTIRGERGEDRDRLADLCTSALAKFELRPKFEFDAADEEGPSPQLVIGGEVVVSGLPSRKSLEMTIRQRLSHW